MRTLEEVAELYLQDAYVASLAYLIANIYVCAQRESPVVDYKFSLITNGLEEFPTWDYERSAEMAAQLLNQHIMAYYPEFLEEF